jgi:AcrR family transcriptional regulator
MRSAEFDREQVLRAAMKAFMHQGYAKTSMQDLKKATGLHPGSIYCAFENKRGLLLASLDQYRHDRKVEFQGFFNNQPSTLTALKNYLDNIVAECVSCDTAQACLLTKALNELAEQDSEIQQYISANLGNLQQSLAEAFGQAKAQGELTTRRTNEQLAQYFLMGIYGLRTFAQTRPAAGVLEQLAAQLFQDICAA